MNKKNIMITGPFSYELGKKKGTLGLLSDHNYSGYFNKLILWSFNFEKEQEFDLDNSVTLIETSKKFHNRILDVFYFIYKGYKIIKKYDLKLIRSTDPYFRGIIGWILSKLCRIPLCISIHADFDKRNELEGKNNELQIFGSWKISSWLELFTLKRADLVLPIRESLAENYIKKGLDKNKIRVIPHGIDFEKFLKNPDVDIYEKFKIDKSKKIISTAGRLKKENYVYDFIEIARLLKNNKIEDFIIIVAGSGLEYDVMNKIINKEELNDYILLIGFQPQEVVASLRKKSYINLCLMAGFSLIEACACERPVISYDVEWHYELVKNYETGFLLPEKNTDAVYERIIYLLENPNKASVYGENAKKLAIEKHEIKITEKIKIDAYNELLNREKINE